jgi:transcriptional regulator with XRE-family HTH domain
MINGGNRNRVDSMTRDSQMQFPISPCASLSCTDVWPAQTQMCPTDICEHFGKRLLQLRTKRGLSQEDLAYSVGMDISYLSELENGKKEPCLRKMKEIAQGLGVTPSRWCGCFDELGQTLRSVSRTGVWELIRVEKVQQRSREPTVSIFPWA